MTAAFAAELLGSGIRVNTIEPRAAVMSEGAEALVGGTLSSDLIESMEAMVEGALVLCDCPADWTGGVHVSPDLLDTLGPHGDDARRQQALPRRATAGAGAGLAAANRHQREPGREQEQSGGLGHPVAHGVTPSIQRSKVVAGGVTTLRAGPAGGSGRRRRR
jgi:hypothetical protein